MKRFAMFGSALLALLLLTGCSGPAGPEGATVNGKIVEDGKPLSLAPAAGGGPTGPASRSIITVELVNNGAVAGSTSLNDDGTFTIQGVKPGKYKMVLRKSGGMMQGSMMDPSKMMSQMQQPGMRPGSDTRGSGMETKMAAAMDGFGGKYLEDKTKIEVEVPDKATVDLPAIDLKDPKYQ